MKPKLGPNILIKKISVTNFDRTFDQILKNLTDSEKLRTQENFDRNFDNFDRKSVKKKVVSGIVINHFEFSSITFLVEICKIS